MKLVATSLSGDFRSKILSSKSRRKTMLFIIYICFSIGTILVSIPSQRINGYLAPTILFQEIDSNRSKCLSLGIFHVIVGSVVLSFVSALAGLVIQSRSKLAIVPELFSVSFLANAGLLMMWALGTSALRSYDIFSVIR